MLATVLLDGRQLLDRPGERPVGEQVASDPADGLQLICELAGESPHRVPDIDGIEERLFRSIRDEPLDPAKAGFHGRPSQRLDFFSSIELGDEQVKRQPLVGESVPLDANAAVGAAERQWNELLHRSTVGECLTDEFGECRDGKVCGGHAARGDHLPEFDMKLGVRHFAPPASPVPEGPSMSMQGSA